jgi:hypothetical protein
LPACLATLFTFVRLGIGTPSTPLRRRLEISARPAKAATGVATAAAAVPFATLPASRHSRLLFALPHVDAPKSSRRTAVVTSWRR